MSDSDRIQSSAVRAGRVVEAAHANPELGPLSVEAERGPIAAHLFVLAVAAEVHH